MAETEYRSHLRNLLILLALGMAVYLPGLGAVSFWDRDEPRFAGTVQEFHRRGDFIVPHFNGRLRPDKPILSYWAMAAGTAVFGRTEFAYRLPSAMAMVLTGLMVYMIARALIGSGSGLVAGAVTMLSPLPLVMGRLCTADALLLLCIVTAIWGALRLWQEGHRLLPWLALWGGLGLGVLTKGPVILAVVIPAAAVLPLGLRDRPRLRTGSAAEREWILIAALVTLAVILWRPVVPPLEIALAGVWAAGLAFALGLTPQTGIRDWRRWILPAVLLLGAQFWGFRAALPPLVFLGACRLTCREPRPLMRFAPVRGSLFMLALVAVWVVPVTLATGGRFLSLSLGRHVLERSLRPLEGHSGWVIYYVLVLPLAFFPWSCYLPGIVADIRRRKLDPILKLPVGWFVVTLVFFSCAGTKLPHYILPAVPPLALLVAWWAREVAAGRLSVAPEAWTVKAFEHAGVLLIVIVSGGVIFGTSWAGFHHNWAVYFAVPAVGLAMIAPAAADLRRRAVLRSLVMSAAGALTLALLTFTVLLPSIERYRSTRPLAEAVKQAAGDELAVAAYGFREPSFIFYMDRRVHVPHNLWALEDLVCLKGEAIAVMKSGRWNRIRTKDLPLEFRGISQHRIFNVAKGRWETVHVARVAHEEPLPRIGMRKSKGRNARAETVSGPIAPEVPDRSE